jgi:hypothetical protein
MIDQNKKGKQEEKRCVLAYGEVTGHAHAFYGEDVAELEGNKLIIKQANAELKHEEHSTHVFEPGIGEVTIQREYQMGEIKRVMD